PLEVLVDSLDAGIRLAVKASGRDSVLSSPVKVSMIVALAPGGAGTSLTLQGKAEVGGKLAALGRGVIQRKARDILNAFAANLDQLVTGQAGTAVVCDQPGAYGGRGHVAHGASRRDPRVRADTISHKSY